jgi:hypothetical protein
MTAPSIVNILHPIDRFEKTCTHRAAHPHALNGYISLSDALKRVDK